MNMMSDAMHVRISGKHAMFTRAECRTERTSAVIGSHASTEGLLSQVMSHKPCRYHIKRVGFLFEPRWFTMTSNEVASFGSGRTIVDVEAKGVHTQRTSTLLAGKQRKVAGRIMAGVDYLVTYHLSFPEIKYLNMLKDRLRTGRYYGNHPFLGMREYPAKVEAVENIRSLTYPEPVDGGAPFKLYEHENGLKTFDLNEDLGICFFGTDWDDPRRPNYFAPLKIVHGVVAYPTWDEVRKLGIKREAET